MKTRYLTLIFSIAILGSSCNLFFEEEPANDPVSVFEFIWQSFDDSYAPFEERNVNWDSLYLIYRPMVNANTDDDSLYNVITNMLAVLDDGHVQMTVPGKKYFFSNHIYNYQIDDALFDLSVIENNYLDNGFIKDDSEYPGFVFGTINNNITYVNFSYIADNLDVMNDVLDNYDTKGLIIDLRHNSGGDFTWAFSNMNRLIQNRTLVFTSKTKNGIGENDYTDWYDWYIEPQTPYYSKKVVLLTDRYTISAGERTAMIFKTMPNAIVIGDTTNGAHSTMIGRELANGWYYTLPTQKVKFADCISYEGIGVIPDIYFKNELSDIENGIDKCLEKAIAEF
ncbi:MAG: S41 family peptidase [Chitinophagales bacterium]|nr:S41 family peptidase [Chitinophagales bacterium]